MTMQSQPRLLLSMTAISLMMCGRVAFAQEEQLATVPPSDGERSHTTFPETFADTELLELEQITVDGELWAEREAKARPAFAQTIQEPHLQTINAWLESATGVFGDASGKGRRDIMVRGFETRQVNFQFDGVPLDTGYDGMTGLDTIPMNWIGHGRIAHADATPTDAVGLGGKVDLYALDPKLIEAALEMNLTGFVGSVAHGMHYDEWRWAATAGGEFSLGFPLSHNFKPNKYEDGGLRDASDRKGGNFLVKVGRSLGTWGDIEIMAGWTQSPRGVPTGVSTDTHRYWRYSAWRTAFASTRLTFDANVLNGQIQLWATDQSNTLHAYDDASRTTQTQSNTYDSVWQDDEYGGRMDLESMAVELPKGSLKALLRTDFRYQIHHSQEDDYLPVKTIIKDSSRFYYDVRPALEWRLNDQYRIFAAGSASGTAGLSASSNDTTNGGKPESLTSGTFSIGVDADILPSLSLGLRVARRLRLPTLKEQFRYIPASDISLPSLSPEVAYDTSLEISYIPIPEVAITLGGFDTEVRDLIEFSYVEGMKISFNVSKARIAGLDVALKLGAWAGFSANVAYQFLYAWDLDNDHALNDRPEHHFTAALHYDLFDMFRFTIRGSYESKRRTEAWMSAKSAWLGGIFLLDAEIEYHIPHFTAYLRGTNLTDYNYARSYGFPEPGFQLTIGAKYTY